MLISMSFIFDEATLALNWFYLLYKIHNFLSQIKYILNQRNRKSNLNFWFMKMTPLTAIPALHILDILSSMSGGRLKIVQSSFPTKFARSEPHLWVIKLWLFDQVPPISVQ